MYYTANPHADAEVLGNKQDEDEAHQETRLERWTEIIEDGFATFGQVPQIYGPTVFFQSFGETVADLVAEDTIFSELLVVLKTSECPKVKALLASMQAKWIRLWVDVMAAEAEPVYPPREPVLKLVPKPVFAAMGLPEVEFPSVRRVAADDAKGGEA